MRDPIGTLAAVLLVLLIGVALVAGWFTQIVVPERVRPFGLISSIYDPPHRSVEVALNVGDGQIFATQADDPWATHRGTIGMGPREEAYRYQRGAYGWLGWLASAGRADAVPWALVALTVASVALLVGVAAELIRRAGGHPTAAVALLITPGVVTNLFFIGPEALGTALVILGTVRWLRRPGSWAAVALFAAGALCRETLLLVPMAVGFTELVVRHRSIALRLLAVPVPYLAWVGFLRARTGAWPEGATDGRLGLVPFAGMVENMSRWGADDVAGLAVLALLGVGGLVVAREPILRAVLASHLVLAAVLGPAVWTEAAHCGRVLLPMGAFGLLSLATGGRLLAGPRPQPAAGLPQSTQCTSSTLVPSTSSLIQSMRATPSTS